MDSNEKKSFKRAMSYKNYNTTDEKKSLSGKPEKIKPEEVKLDTKEIWSSREVKDISKENTSLYQDRIVSTQRLQQAIIWSEILGKPVSKNRKRR